ncbi:MAG: BamA/TamA family outer membrane protein [Gemmatimonadota bacterium]
MSPPLLMILVMASLAWPGDGGAQAQAGPPGEDPCLYGVVGTLEVENGSVFTQEQIRDAPRFPWAYRLANRIHARTNEDLIRRELLFQEGDCYSPRLVDESVRLLRGLPFVAAASIAPPGWDTDEPLPVPSAESRTDLIIRTRDEWTTKPRLNIRSSGDGLKVRGWELREENLLGTGRTVSVAGGRRGGEREFSFLLQDPQFLDTRWDAQLRLGRNRNGNFVDQVLTYPFVGEVGRLAARQRFLREEGEFFWPIGSHSPASDQRITHLAIPLGREVTEVTAAVRLGSPGNLTVLGVGLSHQVLRIPGYPGRLALSRRWEPIPELDVPQELVTEVSGQARGRTATWLNLLLGRRAITFQQRVGLDALRGTQDVPLGTEFGVIVGQRVGSPDPYPGAREDDLSAGVRIFWGSAPDPWVLQTHLAMESRHFRGRADEALRWRDVFLDLDTRAYWLPPRHPEHTVLLNLRVAGGWQVESPFALALGGLGGIRGFREETFPGGRKAVLSVEDRWAIASPASTLFDLGVTFFTDIGRIWPGEVPFGQDTGWRAAVGGGLRVGFPAGTGGVARLDVAVPLTSGLQLNDIVVTLSMQEVLGLLAGVGDPLLARIRWDRVDLDFGGDPG